MNEEKIYNADYSVGGKFTNSIDISWIQFNDAANILRKEYEKDPLRLPIRQTGEYPDEIVASFYRNIGEKRNIQLRRFYSSDIIFAWSDDKNALRNFVVDELRLPEPNFD